LIGPEARLAGVWPHLAGHPDLGVWPREMMAAGPRPGLGWPIMLDRFGHRRLARGWLQGRRPRRHGALPLAPCSPRPIGPSSAAGASLSSWLRIGQPPGRGRIAVPTQRVSLLEMANMRTPDMPSRVVAGTATPATAPSRRRLGAMVLAASALLALLADCGGTDKGGTFFGPAQPLGNGAAHRRCRAKRIRTLEVTGGPH
jgi:hypothetical protein